MPTTHTLECRAYAVGAAVENFLDAHDTTTDPIATGEQYLLDGTVSCRCDQRAVTYYDERTVMLGRIVLNIADRAEGTGPSGTLAPAPAAAGEADTAGTWR